jgi:hypothetical protein
MGTCKFVVESRWVKLETLMAGRPGDSGANGDWGLQIVVIDRTAAGARGSLAASKLGDRVVG